MQALFRGSFELLVLGSARRQVRAASILCVQLNLRFRCLPAGECLSMWSLEAEADTVPPSGFVFVPTPQDVRRYPFRGEQRLEYHAQARGSELLSPVEYCLGTYPVFLPANNRKAESDLESKRHTEQFLNLKCLSLSPH